MSVPWDFLRNASCRSLEDFERFSLDRAAKLRKKVTDLTAQWIDELVCAGIARTRIEEERLRSIGPNPLQQSFDFLESPIRPARPKAYHPQRRPLNRAAD